MAEKRTINIDINNNAEEAAKDFQDFAKATNVANDSVEGLNKTFEEVYGELQPLTTRMGEAEDRLYELALAGDTTSKEYNELLKSVGNYRKVQIQTDLAVDAAATTLSQKLGGALTGATSGFAAVQGVMGLVGSESETLEKTLLKVQSALALQQGVQGVLEYSKSIGLAGKATKVFNLIVKANPLALLATTLIAIIGYFAVFTDAIDQAIDKLKSIGDFIGLTNFKEQKLEDDRKKRHKAELERREQLKKEAEVLKGIRSAQIEQLDALGKETFKLKKAALEAAEAEAKQNFQVEKAIRIRTQIILLEKERAEKLKAQAAERKKIAEEEENRIKKLNEERLKQLDAEKAILQEGSEFLKNANFEEVDSTFNKYAAMGAISMQFYKDEEDLRERNKKFAIDSAFQTLDLISNITELFWKERRKTSKESFSSTESSTNSYNIRNNLLKCDTSLCIAVFTVARSIFTC